jgi:SM-20-related protein
MTHENIGIDPTLDPASLAGAFARHGRIHVPGFLVEGAARRLHQALVEERLWMCATQGGGVNVDIPVEHLDTLTPEQAARFIQLAHSEACTGFHYMFDNLRISDAAARGQPLSPALRDGYAFLNSPAFLRFVAAVTRDDRPNFVDAQATRFEPGHYLNQHDDAKPAAGRLYAYVLNLCPGWRADWGGLLTFLDEDGHVAEAYTPAWNALNLFRVPTQHAVTCVAPFAGGSRLSITGWIRDTRSASL